MSTGSKKDNDSLEALYEKAARSVRKAAKACRVKGGGEACLAMDHSAADIENAPVVGRRLAADRSPTKPGTTPLTGMPPVKETVKATITAPAANEPMTVTASQAVPVAPAVEPAPARDPAVQG